MLLKNRHGYLLGALGLVLSLIGLVFIYSASNYSATLQYGDPLFFVRKQAVALAAGSVLFFIGRVLPPQFWKKAKWVVLAVSLILLALVYIPGLGMSSYGATRWISLGFITFQPSEVSKFGLLIFLAGYLSDHPPVNLKNLIVPILSAGACCALVMIEPNMSITMVVGLSVLVILFVAGMKKKVFTALLLLVVIGAVLLIVIEPYRMKRLFAFLDPWENPKGEGYQLIQSFYAVASGGLFGKGLFNSTQKLLFLPFAESDFIFSVVAEETGLIGCLVLMILYAVFIYCGIGAAMNAKSRYETLLATGITSVVGWQVVINLAVVTGCIPPTGVPLPFVSAGGSSLISFLFFSGVLSGLSARTKDERPS